MKRRSVTPFQLIGVCPRIGCGTDCWLEIDAKCQIDRNIESRELVFCEECATSLIPMQESGEMTLICCHLNASVVQHTSHPDLVPIDKFLKKESLHWFKFQRRPEVIYNSSMMMFTEAERILILAGAGMSADSFNGSTFRNSAIKTSNSLGGWRAPEEISYSKFPAAAWYYDASIRRAAQSSEPHLGYDKLLRLCQTKGSNGFFIITSNIDGFFRKSLFPENLIWETHGSVDFIQCARVPVSERCPGIWPWDESKGSIILHDESCLAELESVPTCPNCHGAARANISHFPDSSDEVAADTKQTQHRNFERWFQRNKHRRVLILEIGCGDSVHGLRCETELLLSSHPSSGLREAKLIRIDIAAEQESEGGNGSNHDNGSHKSDEGHDSCEAFAMPDAEHCVNELKRKRTRRSDRHAGMAADGKSKERQSSRRRDYISSSSSSSSSENAEGGQLESQPQPQPRCLYVRDGALKFLNQLSALILTPSPMTSMPRPPVPTDAEAADSSSSFSAAAALTSGSGTAAVAECVSLPREDDVDVAAFS